MNKDVKTRDGETGGSGGPKSGALSVEADEIVSGGDPGPVKDGRGPATHGGHPPSGREVVSGSDGGPKDGRGIAKS
jgi:hypothetical protein